MWSGYGFRRSVCARKKDGRWHTCGQSMCCAGLFYRPRPTTNQPAVYLRPLAPPQAVGQPKPTHLLPIASSRYSLKILRWRHSSWAEVGVLLRARERRALVFLLESRCKGLRVCVCEDRCMRVRYRLAEFFLVRPSLLHTHGSGQARAISSITSLALRPCKVRAPRCVLSWHVHADRRS